LSSLVLAYRGEANKAASCSAPWRSVTASTSSPTCSVVAPRGNVLKLYLALEEFK
jgi:hypothetical protein